MSLEKLEKHDDEDLQQRADQLIGWLRREMGVAEFDDASPLELERHEERIETVVELSRRLFRT